MSKIMLGMDARLLHRIMEIPFVSRLIIVSAISPVVLSMYNLF